MKTKIQLLITIVAISVAIMLNSHISTDSTPISVETVAAFAQWKQKFGKTYSSPVELAFRLKNFASHLEHVRAVNERYQNGEITWFASLNSFSDTSFEDFRAARLNRKTYTKDQIRHKLENSKGPEVRDIEIMQNPPASKDWRKENVVLPI
jgi:hypothetical protein